MKEETEHWWKQALYELKVAQKLLDSYLYAAASFHAYQAAEMAIKSLYHERHGRVQSHDLKFLLKKLDAPQVVIDNATSLMPIYMDARYPDARDNLPAEEYTEDDSKEDMQKAEEIINWIEEQLR